MALPPPIEHAHATQHPTRTNNQESQLQLCVQGKKNGNPTTKNSKLTSTSSAHPNGNRSPPPFPTSMLQPPQGHNRDGEKIVGEGKTSEALLKHTTLPNSLFVSLVEEGEELIEAELLKLEQLADGLVLIDATEQQVYRPGKSNEERQKFFSGKRKQFTRKTQLAADGQHHIEAISVSVPGAKSDIKLSDEVGTVERLPDDCEAQADKGYQGLDKRVDLVTIQDAETGEQKQVPRLIIKTPVKKPKGGELNEEQKAYNRAIGQVRVRVEHCIGWVKNWAIIATRFRCAHSIYTEVMQVVCGLVNLQTQRWQAAKSQAVG